MARIERADNMRSIREILKEAVTLNASDIFIVTGTPVSFKVFGNVMRCDDETVTPADSAQLMKELFLLAELDTEAEDLRREMDFSFSFAGVGRFRVNAYRQRGTLAAVLRSVPFELPDSGNASYPRQHIVTGGEPERHYPCNGSGRQRKIHHPYLYDRQDKQRAPGAYRYH